MPLPDVRLLPDAARNIAADRAKAQYDIGLPPLKYWNYDLCREHRMGWVETLWDAGRQVEYLHTVNDRPKPGCQKCGIHFRRHQRVGIAWLYLKGRGLLADTVGSGKTTQAAGLIAVMAENGELDRGERVIIPARSGALLQWERALGRMIPGLGVQVAAGTKRQRQERYAAPWQVLLIGPEMFNNDYEMLLGNFRFAAAIIDDIDPLRSPDTKTAYTLKWLAQNTPRFVVMTGTPLQKRLHELYSILEPLGGRAVLGSEQAFKTRYVRSENITGYNHSTGRKTTVNKVVGYKNVNEFIRLLNPFALRRVASDIDDVDLPAVNPVNVDLELYPAQRDKYEQLKKDVVVINRTEGQQVKRVAAMAKLIYGAKICGGLATLGEPDGPGASVKLDWIMDKVSEDGDLADEKVVIFGAYKDTLRALQARLTAAGIGYETIWGEEPNKYIRDRSQQRFWNDPSCKILMGTQSIEQSLNLQVSRHMINIDMILNPARMEQLAGRIRRDGSAFKHVFIHNLLTTNTQEARYLPALEREQALIDTVWNEESELFEALSPLALLSLITG